jgi:hypothetical protein
VASLADVFRVLNDMKADRIIEDYAIGGAMAVLFYAEPTRTYDLDVFVLLPASDEPLINLTPMYAWLQERGFEPEAEHVVVHGVPVQLIPAYNGLVEEAISEAQELDYDTVPVRVTSPEHLIALAFQAGGRKRRERAFQLLETVDIDRDKLDELLDRHRVERPWSSHE